MRYFIVDDDPGVRSMLMDIIEDEGLGEIVGKPMMELIFMLNCWSCIRWMYC